MSWEDSGPLEAEGSRPQYQESHITPSLQTPLLMCFVHTEVAVAFSFIYIWTNLIASRNPNISQISRDVSVASTHFHTRGPQTILGTSPKISHVHKITLGLKAPFTLLLYAVLQNSCDRFHWSCGCQFGKYIPHCCLSNINTSCLVIRVYKCTININTPSCCTGLKDNNKRET